MSGVMRKFEVRIPQKLQKRYGSLPVYASPSMIGPPTERIRGDHVMGTLDPKGRFVQIRSGYIPLQLDGVRVLFESIPSTVAAVKGEWTWLVRVNVQTGLLGIFAYDCRLESIKNSFFSWGTQVKGIQVDENWVMVGPNFFLPLRLEIGKPRQMYQVLWPQEMVSVEVNSSSAGSETVRVYLLAPESRDGFSLAGPGGWKQVLEPETISSSLASMLKPNQVQFLDVRISDLTNAEFKFRCAKERGYFDTVTSVASYVFSWEDTDLDWEYDSENNRIVKWDCPVSTLYMSFGKPEPSKDDIVDFLKLALSGALQDLSCVIAKVNEVSQSVLQVSCKQPSRNRKRICMEECLRRALSELLGGVTQPKPCQGLYMWLAVLEQQFKGNLKDLNPLPSQELLSLISIWPADIMSHVVLQDRGHEAAKGVVLEAARGAEQLSKEWLQAAIQVVVNGDVSTNEVTQLKQCAARVQDLPEWERMWQRVGLQHAPHAAVQNALRVALGPAKVPKQVWDAARHFLHVIIRLRPDVQQACARVALAEALTCCGIEMNCNDILSWLDQVLKMLGKGSFDTRLELDLTNLIRDSWNNCRVLILERVSGVQIAGATACTTAERILARALTDDPGRACMVTFQRPAEFLWFRLASFVRFEHRVLASVGHRGCNRLEVGVSSDWTGFQVLFF
eukprot:s32_g20.t1